MYWLGVVLAFIGAGLILSALTFVSASANKTISYGVTTDLIRGDVFYWGSLMSGALIGALPVAIVCAFSLDHFIHGLTAGALK